MVRALGGKVAHITSSFISACQLQANTLKHAYRNDRLFLKIAIEVPDELTDVFV